MNSSPRKFEMKKSTELRNASKFTTDEMIDIKSVKCEIKEVINETNAKEEEEKNKQNNLS
jgi:hypothetical protein